MHVLLSQKMRRVLSYTGFVYKVYTACRICSGYQNPGLRKIVSTPSLQAKTKRVVRILFLLFPAALGFEFKRSVSWSVNICQT